MEWDELTKLARVRMKIEKMRERSTKREQKEEKDKRIKQSIKNIYFREMMSER